ncbi:MAG: hypothetical protein HC876_01210 [Chloroflexaceae bacterium]|nr:hypothetical protein [Chloroflexaceae bacterium]NJO04254.1 hypothetical protein [Chloroflexaceae bacterium]
MLYGAHNLPVELTIKVRPARRPDMHLHVAQYVADFCHENGITEEMICDITMEEMNHGDDIEGSFSQVRVRFTYN